MSFENPAVQALGIDTSDSQTRWAPTDRISVAAHVTAARMAPLALRQAQA